MTKAELINAAVKEAMKAKDKERLAALRGVKSALMLAATDKGAGGTVDAATEDKIIAKLYKQRIDAAEIYKGQNRDDLVQEEMGQAAVIKEFMPEQMDAGELRSVLEKIIADTGAAGPKDMGKVMGMASKQLAGKADGKAISTIVRELLAG